MISFGPTEEQELVRDAMREFAGAALRPIARECDEDSKLQAGFLEQAWELGLVDTQIPEAYGGGGEARSPITNALVLEELGHGDATLALAMTVPAGFANAIVDQGSEAQKAELLPLFCQGAPHTAAIAWVEPGALFEPLSPRCEAKPADGGYVLEGAKSFVPLAESASHFLVVARCGGELGAFVVPRDADGVSLSQTEQHLGLRALATCRVDFAGVKLGAEARLGGSGGCDVRRLLAQSRSALAAVMVGLSRAVLEYAVPYAKEREAFDQAIAQKQSIAFRLADMHIETESMRWLTWKAASQLEQGLDATAAAHHARAYAARQSLWVADEGIQVLGGHGFIREHPVEMWFRNARTLSVLEGTLAL